jgi:cytochrome c-type biogenesis protein CcmH/NrfF
MKQIEAFVDSVYQNVGGNEKEIQELKAEMKNHLLEAVDELKKEGKSEQEAIDIAIDRFG